MSVNYSILANNPVWNGNTTISDATAVPKFVAAVGGGSGAGGTASSGGAMMVTVPSAYRTVTISNVGSVNLFLADSSKMPIPTATSLGSNGILLQPGAAITIGLSGADLVLYNQSTVTDGSFVSVSYS